MLILSTTNNVVDRAKNNVHIHTLFLPKNRDDPHTFPIFWIFTPSVSMFIGQGLSLEARHAAQAERRSANTATAAASATAAAVQLYILGIFQCNRVQAKHVLN